MLHIRPAISSDATALTNLAVVTFTDTYGSKNSPENMANYLADHFSETQIRQELDDPNSFYFLAFWEETLVGYLKLRSGHEPPELDNTSAIEIERIYVLQAFHQYKIGYAQMQHALQVAKEKGFEAVWLGVWTENPRAIAFYQKVGFEIFGTHEFVLGDDRQLDYLMKIPLAMVLVPIGKELADNAAFLENPLCRDTLPATVDYFNRVGHCPPWIGYYAWQYGNFVGAAGFKGPPVNNTVEIAYGTFEHCRQKGIGTEMCRLLVELALKSDAAIKITARTLPEKNFSTKILEKNGFELLGTVNDPEDGEVWEWEFK